jgi:hypothetical protein
MIKKLLKLYGMLWLGLLGLIAILIVLIGVAWAYEAFLYSQRPDITKSAMQEATAISEEFNNRIRLEIPTGTTEEAALTRLTALGFITQADEHHAFYKRGRFPCAHQWIIVWKPDNQKRIADLQGRFDAICP